jgi:hypothetical protein
MAKNLLQNGCDLVPVTPAVATAQLADPFGLVKVQSQPLSSVSSVNFINLAQYPYTNYNLRLGITSHTANAQIALLVSTNNGSSYINTNYTSNSYYALTTASALSFNGVATTSLVVTTLYGGAGIMSSEIQIFNVNSSVGTFAAFSRTFIVNPNGYFDQGYGVYTISGTPINAFQVLISGGGTVSGSASLYGYN